MDNRISDSNGETKLWPLLAGSSSMFLWGIVLFMSISVYKFVKIPSGLSYVYPIAAAFGLLTGNLLMGYISDKIGRKLPFLISIYFTGLGIIGAVFSADFLQLTIFVFVSNFFLGGDETVLISYLYEKFRGKARSRYIVAVTNMANGGVFFSAFFLYAFPLTENGIREFLLVSSIIIVVIGIVSRHKISENNRWDIWKSTPPTGTMRNRRIRETWNYNGNHFTVLADFEQLTTGTAIVTGFFLINIYFGDLYANQPYYVTLLTTSTGFIAGIILAIFVKQLPHRVIPLISFPLMAVLVLSASIFSYFSVLPFALLIWILMLRSFLSEIGWGSRDILQTELAFTPERGRHISRIRAFSYSILILLYFVIYTMKPSLLIYLIIISVVEIMAAAGAILWYFRGVETGEKDLS